MKRQSWKDQLAVGRAFELKARHGGRDPICVMIVRDPHQPSYGYPIAVQIDERGMRSEGYWNQRRFWAGGLRLQDFTSAKIARRRFDLERFDARDIELINYGIGLKFTGEFTGNSYSRRHIPDISGFGDIVWTIFWTPVENWDFHVSNPEHAELRDALRGAWHFTSYGDGSINRRPVAWATTKTNHAELRRIGTILRRHHPNVQRSEFAFRSVADEKGIFMLPIGQLGPCLWSVSSAFHAFDGTRGFAISSS